MPSLFRLHSPSRKGSKDPDVVANEDSQKVEVFDDEPVLDINPGELTFEEGTFAKPLSCVAVASDGFCTARHGRRNWSPLGYIRLHDDYVWLLSIQLCYLTLWLLTVLALWSALVYFRLRHPSSDQLGP